MRCVCCCRLLLAMGSLAEEVYQVKEARRSQRQIRNQLLEKTQLQLQHNAKLSRYHECLWIFILLVRGYVGYHCCCPANSIISLNYKDEDVKVALMSKL